MDESSQIKWLDDVELDRPVLIAAFRGWNDAGDSASFSAQHLAGVWGAKPIATIDPEEFYDFQATRPNVRLVDGFTREIEWPSNEFWSAKLLDAPHDVIILVGTEPNLKWKTFSRLVAEVAERAGVELVITLGALLADVPHSRPTQITGTAGDEELVKRLHLERSRYEGPTGIVGVLHDTFARAKVPSASLWAAVPHYLSVTPNPKAALALVRKAVELIRAPADVSELEAATVAYEDKVDEIIASDEDVQSYVKLLEERADERNREEQIDLSDLPSGDTIAAELEDFLRNRET
jgi:predicted ATP-grasp superfamily ATP-dependent carboligase